MPSSPSSPGSATRRAPRGPARPGLDEALLERVAAGRPLLGICVGMQLLFGESEEGGAGLGILEGSVESCGPSASRTWAGTSSTSRNGSVLLDGLDRRDVYFAHSFALRRPSSRSRSAQVDHGGPVVAAVEHGAVAGVQFHPERSGAAGARLLANVLRWSSTA